MAYAGKPVQVLNRPMTSLPVTVSGLAELSPKLTPPELLNYWKGLGWQHIYLDEGEAVRSFLKCGMLNQFTLTRIPIILSTGKPLFEITLPEIVLRNLHTGDFASGLVQSTYEVI